MVDQLFFELLQVAVGNKSQLSRIPLPQEWNQLFAMTQKQSLTGIAFYAIQRLPPEQWPHKSIVLQWTVIAQSIKQRNILTTQVCQKLCAQYAEDGFASCILKGQANHRYYGDEFSNLRICGDIDVWLTPINKHCKHPVASVIRYLQQTTGIESLCYLHAEVKPINGVPVEVHLRSSFMNAPIRNHRFLKLFNFADCVCQEQVDDTLLFVLKKDYDVIFQMNHLYRHLIDEGVGLRQVLDYYMLLQSWNNEKVWTTEKIMAQVIRLGMARFASALMYVLQEVFGMSNELLLCSPSEKDGRFLLEEMMLAGNFGHSDPRMASLTVKKGKLSYQTKRAWRRVSRNFRFISSYPEEVICEPFARIAHLWWRKFSLWKY